MLSRAKRVSKHAAKTLPLAIFPDSQFQPPPACEGIGPGPKPIRM
jgi:hypothetical protein